MHTTVPLETNSGANPLPPYPGTQAPNNLIYGSAAISQGASSVAVTETFLAIPTQIICNVRGPANALVIAASIDAASISLTGFTAYLTGVTDQVGYQLDWIAIF